MSDPRAALEAVLDAAGGCADRRSVVRAVGRRRLDRFVEDGTLVRRARGLYALASTPTVEEHIALAWGGVLADASAARHWGWDLLRQPRTTTVVVRRHRNVVMLKGVRTSVRRLADDEIRDGATSPLRTVLDCCTALPTEEALAVADSALRSGLVEKDELQDAASMSKGPGRRARLRIAQLADGLAANPFESVLRLRCLDAGLDVRPQVLVATLGHRVDLADVGRSVAVEGDSFTFHASPVAFARDCVRYSELTVRGWTVLRMPYHRVVDDREWCEEVLSRAAQLSTGHRGGGR